MNHCRKVKEVDHMNHPETARALFLKGYNCAQAVFCAFTDVTGLSRDESARIASSFGGGFGRLREVCGTMSAAVLILGYARGYSDPNDRNAKIRHYKLVQEYARRFREANGALLCRDLLKDVETKEGPEPEERTQEYYARRPCPMIAYRAADILDRMLKESAEE
jgi:C_GCAxxG_C_C family probable redox protein